MSIKITKDGEKIFCQATGQPKLEMFPEKEGFFFLKVADVQIEFNINKNARVSELILHQGGQKIKAEKVK